MRADFELFAAWQLPTMQLHSSAQLELAMPLLLLGEQQDLG